MTADNRWGVLAILCLARMSMGLHLQAVAAVGPFLIADLGLSYAELGLLIGVFLLPGAFLALPGSLIGRRFGDKATLVGGIALLSLGTGLLALSPGYGPAVAARLLGGAGATLLTMQVAKVATDWFAGKELATAVGLLVATFPLGAGLAMALLGSVAAATSWRLGVGLVALSAVVILAVVALLYRDPSREPPDGAVDRDPAGVARRPNFWAISAREARLVLLAGWAFALVNAALVVVTSFAPALLIERGRSEVQAGVLASWASWSLIPSVMLAGYLLDRTRRLMTWLGVSAALTAGVCAMLSTWEPAWLPIVLFGIVSAPVTVGAMALPGRVLRPESRHTGFGLYFTTNYIGFGLLPPVAGSLLDLTGNPAAPLWFAGLLYLAVVPSLLLFEWLRRAEPLPTAPATPTAGAGTSDVPSA